MARSVPRHTHRNPLDTAHGRGPGHAVRSRDPDQVTDYGGTARACKPDREERAGCLLPSRTGDGRLPGVRTILAATGISMRILLTGGCGFIGSAVVRRLIRDGDHSVVNVDVMTYAASEDALEDAGSSPRYVHVRADITDADAIARAFAEADPDAVMHLAAEKPCRPFDRWTRAVHPHQRRRHAGDAGGRPQALGTARPRATRAVPFPPHLDRRGVSARWESTIRRSPRRRLMIRAVPIRRARRRRIISFARGSTPIISRPS